MAEKLGAGDMFPSMTLELTTGESLHLPGDLSSDYTVVLFYRGHW